jgi:putative acetyltransferase
MTSETATLPKSVIRPATKADLPACARIINDYIDATDWLPRVYSHEAIDALFSPGLLEKRAILLAEIGGEAAGYLSMADDGMIQALYLAPHARGQGIGRQLLDRARELCPRQLELTVFEPNVDAKRFYEREGFREVPEGRRDDTEEGVPILLMRWRGAP